jgi:hypothetical protein
MCFWLPKPVDVAFRATMYISVLLLNTIQMDPAAAIALLRTMLVVSLQQGSWPLVPDRAILLWTSQR